MFIVRCDRCGKENEMQNIYPVYGENKQGCVPKYSIMEFGNDGVRTITLCSDCENAFDMWIKNDK